jgi:5'-nucleotidase
VTASHDPRERIAVLNWNRRPGELALAIDMDEVLADTLGWQLYLYNQRFGTCVLPDDLDGVDLIDIVPAEHKHWAAEIFNEPGFFADIPPMPGALEAMERLCQSHRVFIASAATEFPGSFREKMDWLARYLPQIPVPRIVFCGEKSVLDVDCLLDDTTSHFANLNGKPLLFDAPHNRKETRYERVSSWNEVEAAIAALSAARA